MENKENIGQNVPPNDEPKTEKSNLNVNCKAFVPDYTLGHHFSKNSEAFKPSEEIK